MKKRHFLWLFGYAAGVAGIGLLVQRWNKQFLQAQLRTKVIPTGEGYIRMGKQVQVSTLLNCPAEQVWQLAQTSGLSQHLAWPWLSLASIDHSDLPALWQTGETLRIQLRFLDLLPIDWQTVTVEKVDDQQRYLQTKQTGHYFSIFNHRIELHETEDRRTIFTDTVELYAGPRTDLAASLLSWFLRYRQARLRTLVSRLGND